MPVARRRTELVLAFAVVALALGVVFARVAAAASGLKLRKAQARLRRAHCRSGRVRTKRSTAKRRGRVIGQSPRAGARRPAGARVRLTVGR
jgi:beta-lactam-binding protein with PASTA domain